VVVKRQEAQDEAVSEARSQLPRLSHSQPAGWTPAWREPAEQLHTQATRSAVIAPHQQQQPLPPQPPLLQPPLLQPPQQQTEACMVSLPQRATWLLGGAMLPLCHRTVHAAAGSYRRGSAQPTRRLPTHDGVMRAAGHAQLVQQRLEDAQQLLCNYVHREAQGDERALQAGHPVPHAGRSEPLLSYRLAHLHTRATGWVAGRCCVRALNYLGTSVAVSTWQHPCERGGHPTA
jgi:hypothetical protein